VVGQQDEMERDRPVPMNNSLIKIEGLAKHYCTKKGEETIALTDVSLDIQEGEFVALVGPSGCGKTTLLKILAGLEHGFSGKVTLNHQPITKPSPDVGMVFQEPTLLPWRTILQNILLPIELKHCDKNHYRQRAQMLMTMIGLEGFEHKYPRELSGGMRQRAGICRALIRDPKVLLMDEPFGALDAMTREFLNAELQRIWLQSKKTIVFVTHSIPEAVFLADRVVVMSPRPGRISEIVPVHLGRERNLSDLGQPEASYLLSHIRRHFNASTLD